VLNKYTVSYTAGQLLGIRWDEGVSSFQRCNRTPNKISGKLSKTDLDRMFCEGIDRQLKNLGVPKEGSLQLWKSQNYTADV
jgi:hypothetical protein